MTKADAITLWVQDRHPTMTVIYKGDGRYCLVENPYAEDMLVEIDFYDDADLFYVYPRRGTKGVLPAFSAHITDPAYLNNLDEVIHMASSANKYQPIIHNGHPLWKL